MIPPKRRRVLTVRTAVPKCKIGSAAYKSAVVTAHFEQSVVHVSVQRKPLGSISFCCSWKSKGLRCRRHVHQPDSARRFDSPTHQLLRQPGNEFTSGFSLRTLRKPVRRPFTIRTCRHDLPSVGTTFGQLDSYIRFNVSGWCAKFHLGFVNYHLQLPTDSCKGSQIRAGFEQTSGTWSNKNGGTYVRRLN